MILVWPDWMVLAIFLVSIFIGGIRGAVREFFSLISWVLSFLLATQLVRYCEGWLAGFVTNVTFRWVLAFVGIFIVAMILIHWLGSFLGLLIEKIGLRPVDRALGILFGLLRGMIIVLLIVFFASMSPLAHDPIWQKAYSIRTIQRISHQLVQLLPNHWQAKIHG